ncbi:MAG: acetamidase/formamidase family protein [Tissierellaceae bacterium]
MKKVTGERVIYKFSNEMEAVVTVSQGEIIKVHTNDCFFQQIYDESQILESIDYDLLNPATGPIYVEGAEPGDILRVKILDIEVGSKGVAAVVAGEGVLGEQVKNPKVRIINIVDGFAIYDKHIKIPIDPMIGVIGVAPAEEDGEWATNSPWKHGGNMDTTDIRTGSTLYFSVNQKGALLALGDCHAAMGDGEMCFTGLEVPAKVLLKLEVIKSKSIKWPIVETKDHTMIIASGDSIDEAIYEASNQAIGHMRDSLDIQWEDAYILGSLVVDLKVSQVVDPKVTVRAAIPKNIVSTKQIIESIVGQ